jgi:anti-sigma regulatory factor (Ser/Thr protein kinase)
VRLRPTVRAAEDARRALDGLLDESGNPRFAFFLRLVASELVNNAVVHGSERAPISMTARLFADSAELQIANRGGRLSMRRMRERRAKGGRGLDIVDELADAWSIDTGPAGTKVTVHLPMMSTERDRSDRPVPGSVDRPVPGSFVSGPIANG